MRKWTYKFMRDEALMAQYANGHHHAFECLYRRHKTRLYGFLKRQCANHAICEELAHDTWIAVISHADSYQTSARFTTWLFRIAHNRLIDHWRKQGNSANALFKEIVEQIELNNNLVSEGPEIKNLEIEDLLKNLERLPSEQTEALLLKIEGFSHAEIADITNTKQETVKSRLRYANQHLRLAMEPSS